MDEATDCTTTVSQLVEAVAAFRDEREWAQFHTPKNLSMSIAIEAAELMEHFQWIDAEAARELLQEPAARAAVADELADVLMYCLSLASIAGYDVTTIIKRKMVANARKYPVERYRGRF